jgi:hypothetical protein
VNTSELLLLAAQAEVSFWLDGDRLAYRAPKGKMSGELRAEVIAHKAELIALLRRSQLDTAVLVAPPPEAGSAAPLASGQERLWLIERRIGPSPLYNIHFRLLWHGVLDLEILALSIGDIVARHDALRTTFAESDGQARLVVSPPAGVPLAHLDLREHDPDAKAGAAGQFIAEQQGTPFELDRGPLVRAGVVTLADDDHVVAVTQHHIITDGWSLRTFLTELGQAYLARFLGQQLALPEPGWSYRDYARWERGWRAEQAYAERLAWWQEHLAGLPPLELRRTQHRPATAPDFGGAVHDFRVPAELTAQLKDLARQQHCTLYTVLLTAWAILLHRHASQADFVIGTVTSGRDRMEFQQLVGFFANTVVLRCDLSGNPSVVEAIARLRAETEAVFEREIPFADIVMAAGAVPDAGLTPLIQAAFMFPNLPAPDFLNPRDLARIKASVTVDARVDGSVAGTTKFDLFLTVQESGDSIAGCLEYATAQYSAAEIQRIQQHFLVLLRSIVDSPHETVGRLKLISKQERQRLLVLGNQ